MKLSVYNRAKDCQTKHSIVYEGIQKVQWHRNAQSNNINTVLLTLGRISFWNGHVHKWTLLDFCTWFWSKLPTVFYKAKPTSVLWFVLKPQQQCPHQSSVKWIRCTNHIWANWIIFTETNICDIYQKKPGLENIILLIS